MIYELANIIKKNFSFLWDVIEYGNSLAFYVIYRKRLNKIGDAANKSIPSGLRMKVLQKTDIDSLYEFFDRQPKDSFRFFNPHGFDKRSLLKVVCNKSFLAFSLIDISTADEPIVGYAFMRSFINGSAYRGYMVDYQYRGRGLAKKMGIGLNYIGDTLGLRMYKSISPENHASMKVTQDVCDIEIVKKLDNGDYLLKCMSKKSETGNPIGEGGGKDLILSLLNKFYKARKPQIRYCYAA